MISYLTPTDWLEARTNCPRSTESYFQKLAGSSFSSLYPEQLLVRYWRPDGRSCFSRRSDIPEVTKQLMAIVGVVKYDRKRGGEEMWSPRGNQYERFAPPSYLFFCTGMISGLSIWCQQHQTSSRGNLTGYYKRYIYLLYPIRGFVGWCLPPL